MPTLEINGASIEYIESGAGEALVLVHGSASDCRTWRLQQEAFAKHFRTIAYSRRYHWPNRPMPHGADYSMREHVDDLQALITWLDASPAHLVGHSYGAVLCLLLAIRAPGLVRTLVLTEPPALTLFVSDPPRPAQLLKLLSTRPRTAAAIVGFAARGLAPATKAARRHDMPRAMRIFGKAILGRAFYERLSEQRLEQVRANAIRAEFIGSGFAPLDPDALRRLRVPALLITSQYSAEVFRQLADRLGELLPQAEHVRLEGTSHIVHEDDALAYNRAVLSFLRNRQRPPAQPVS